MSIWDYMKKAEQPLVPQAIERTSDRKLAIRWADGLQTAATPRELRLGCQCAHCIDEFTRRPLLDPASVPPDVDIAAMEPVGNYALHLDFSDGHSSGIFDWKLLRRLSAGSDV